MQIELPITVFQNKSNLYSNMYNDNANLSINTIPATINPTSRGNIIIGYLTLFQNSDRRPDPHRTDGTHREHRNWPRRAGDARVLLLRWPRWQDLLRDLRRWRQRLQGLWRSPPHSSPNPRSYLTVSIKLHLLLLHLLLPLHMWWRIVDGFHQ